MNVTAHLRHLHMSPRKVRLVADLVRGLDVADADAQLMHLPKAAATPIRKLIHSAVANAEHNAQLSPENLFVAQIAVNQGPTAKRFRARAFGRAAVIRKRTSHVSVVLGERVPTVGAHMVKTAAPPPVLVTDRPSTGGPEAEVVRASASGPVAPATESTEGQELTDVRRKGKHRHQEHADARSGKRSGGFFKRFLTRRFGER